MKLLYFLAVVNSYLAILALSSIPHAANNLQARDGHRLNINTAMSIGGKHGLARRRVEYQ
jgi:hypothetical protein